LTLFELDEPAGPKCETVTQVPIS